MPVCCGDSTPCPLPKAEVTLSLPGKRQASQPGSWGCAGSPAGAVLSGPGLSHARAKLLARATLRQADLVCPWG